MTYNGDELYHFGVRGMKWGHRKQVIRTARRQTGWGASRQEKKAAVNKALAADTSRRVNKYGATSVKRRNRLRSIGTVAGSALAVGILRNLGRQTSSQTLKVAAGAAALGITAKAIKKVNARHKENKSINQKYKRK